MRDRVRKRTLSVIVVVFGLCSSMGGENAVAFVPSAQHMNCPRTATHGYYYQSTRTTSVATGHDRMIILSMVGTKRPRLTEEITLKAATTEDHNVSSVAKPKITFGYLPDFMQKDPLLVTKEKWKEKTMLSEIIEENTSETKRQKSEMMAMTAVSAVFAIGVIYALASNTPNMITVDPKEFNSESENVVRGLFREGNAERLEVATRNIVGTVLPQNAEDVIAVSIGEGLAGAIGAFATWLLGMILNFKNDEDFIIEPISASMKSTGIEPTTKRPLGGRNMDSLVSGAVADGDYFFTRAAAQPLLEALGIPTFFASLASVLIATVPYEAVKISSQSRRNEVEKQEALLEMLLKEEEDRRKNFGMKRKLDIGGASYIMDKLSNNAFDFIQRLNVRPSMDDFVEEDVEEIIPVKNEQLPVVDYVELFADITKWLEYDVLITNYRGILSMPNGEMLSAGWESAIFGLLAALSSQLYQDVLYLYSDFGNPMKREMTLNRSPEGWASIYATKTLSAATLFGVYEGVRGPTSRLLSQIISGGIGGCLGSKDYDMCMETYLIDNPPAASLQAEFRASVVSVMNSLDSFSYLLPLNDKETLESFFRGVAVSVYSELLRFSSG